MSTTQDLAKLKERIGELQTQVQTITDDEWQAYIKVRDILSLGSGLIFEGGEESAVLADSGGGLLFHAHVVRCAMLGMFEPAFGSGSVDGYDASAVQRFADLGG
ncbi:hypothetical protein ACXC9Q_30230 [Kribbella sp. CWNU-51]